MGQKWPWGQGTGSDVLRKQKKEAGQRAHATRPLELLYLPGSHREGIALPTGHSAPGGHGNVALL